ncbi:recombinase family protein [Clostridium sporogenes]|uniref:Recombinase family protein n=1 Tax=Clostridium sulfidigenes TaxID=318464 RepID=A0A927ZKQ0_9CLOT|nr:recombinase family protein [Clostridium sporogenes]EDU37898.1 resolvase, N-terminal domain protein [Clostridium sporogenes ATCC 15579]MBE6060554.1 recombinase family protein [Clostridium sulfidigenes]NFE66795.1 recombinase family protein [Clostridium sporogenes]
MIKAAFYGRFSSNNQREESIDAQLRATEEFAEKNGYDIVCNYADKAKSGRSDKRPEFLKMIKDAEKGLFNVVIVHKLDRFSRDKYHSAVYKRKLKQYGVRLVSVTEQLDGSPESVILESVIEGMAEYYSKNLARETMKGLKENAYQCKHTGGLAPLGYEVNEEKKYVINEREAESVRLIFDMYISGYSHSQMVDELNARGFKTKVGAIFRINSINSVLNNEKYTGVYIYNKSAKKDAFGKRNSHAYKDPSEIIKIEGGMPQIVSKDTFKKAQDILKSRKRKPGANKAKENYLLSGLIKCGCCGKSYQGNRRQAQNKPMYISYRCSYRGATSSKVCDNKEIRKEYVEEYVLSELERKIFNDGAIAYLVAGINNNLQKQNKIDDEKKEVIVNELKEIDAKINNIVTAIASGFMQEEFKMKMDELKEKKSDLEFKQAQLKSNDITQVVTEKDVRNLLNNFSGYVISRNIPECKKFIQNFVKEIVIYKEHIEVIFNVSFNMFKNCEEVEVFSKIKRYDLYSRYSKSFYINVS